MDSYHGRNNVLRIFVWKAVMKMYKTAKKKKRRTMENKNRQGDEGYTTMGRQTAKFTKSLLL